MSELLQEVTETTDGRRRPGAKPAKRTYTRCPRCKRESPPEGFYANGYCKPCGAAYYRERTKKHPEENKASHKRYYKKHHAKVLSAARAYQQKFRNMVLDHYGRSCSCCGESHVEFLAIDHVNDDGAAHRRELFGHNKGGNGLAFYRWLRDNSFPEDFQTLCHNCNLAKAFYGQCPHAAERMKT